jgi:hypothetical protein
MAITQVVVIIELLLDLSQHNVLLFNVIMKKRCVLQIVTIYVTVTEVTS